MNFDKKKELYWIAGMVLATIMIGLVLFGTSLGDGEPIDVQLHDTYFVFSKGSFLAVFFSLLLVVVYGCRAIFGRTTATFKVIAVLLAVVVLGTLVTLVSAGYQLFREKTTEAMQQLRTDVGFSPLNYPPDYTIRYDTLAVDSFRVVLIVCRDTRPGSLNSGDVWMRCLVDDSVTITETYIGPLESEAGVWIPDPQPISGMFMAIHCGEYDGIVHLVDNDGVFTSFPGRRYALDEENRIYTAYAQYDTLIHVYDITKRTGESLLGKHMVRGNLVLRGDGAGGYWVK